MVAYYFRCFLVVLLVVTVCGGTQRPRVTFDYQIPQHLSLTKLALTVQNSDKTSLQSVSSFRLTTNFQPEVIQSTCFGVDRRHLTHSFQTRVDSFSGTDLFQFIVTIKKSATQTTMDTRESCNFTMTHPDQAQLFENMSIPVIYHLALDDYPVRLRNNCTGSRDCISQESTGLINGGYFIGFSGYQRMNIYDIPVQHLTRIYYAFLDMNQTTGNVKPLNPRVDIHNFRALAKMKIAYPHIKIIFSLGGWFNHLEISAAQQFEAIYSNQTKLDLFLKDLVRVLRFLRFDGMDSDWEYHQNHDFRQAPATILLDFHRQLHEAFTEASKKDKKKYYMSFCINAKKAWIAGMDNPIYPVGPEGFWKQFSRYIDYVHIMNYGFINGAHNIYIHPQSVYRQPVNVEHDYYRRGMNNMEESIRELKKRGVPANKVVFGMAAQVRVFKPNFNTTDGGLYKLSREHGTGDREWGLLDYKCLMNPIVNVRFGCSPSIRNMEAVRSAVFYNSTSNEETLRKMDGYVTLQPWAYDDISRSTYIFDDAWSVTQKCKIIRNHRFGGMFIWSFDGDLLDSDERSLVRAAHFGLFADGVAS